MRFITKYRLSYILVLYLALAVSLGFWMMHLGISQKIAMTYVVSNLLTVTFFTFILSRIHLFYHSKSAISSVHIGIITLFSFLGVWIAHIVNKLIFGDIAPSTHHLNEIFPFAFFVFFLLLLLAANQFWIDKHIQVQEKTLEQLLKKERDLLRAELSNIQEQFRPHFIFNSLNSISALTTCDPEKAREMIHLLSDFLRANVIRDDEKFHSLKEEIHFLNLYLSIEKVRFEDRLTIETSEIKGMEDAQVPILILQPIMENAIKFGLYGMTGKVKIKLNITQLDGAIRIEAVNPFDKDAALASKGKGYGIDSIRKKMYLFFQRNDLIDIEISKNEKGENQYTFQLTIPQT